LALREVEGVTVVQHKSFSGMNCSIARALDQVGEWWSLLIIRECTQGATRFAEFQGSLGIAKNILASRLERLTQLGILERYPLDERANADGYRLTEKGEQLYPVLVALMQWGDRWATPSGKPSVALLDDATGRPIEALKVRGKAGRPLSFREVRFAEGPGATSNSRAVIAKRNARVLG
jgi:DNA-binding HxlR family transcriptional regulator